MKKILFTTPLFLSLLNCGGGSSDDSNGSQLAAISVNTEVGVDYDTLKLYRSVSGSELKLTPEFLMASFSSAQESSEAMVPVGLQNFHVELYKQVEGQETLVASSAVAPCSSVEVDVKFGYENKLDIDVCGVQSPRPGDANLEVDVNFIDLDSMIASNDIITCAFESKPDQGIKLVFADVDYERVNKGNMSLTFQGNTGQPLTEDDSVFRYTDTHLIVAAGTSLSFGFDLVGDKDVSLAGTGRVVFSSGSRELIDCAFTNRSQ